MHLALTLFAIGILCGVDALTTNSRFHRYAARFAPELVPGTDGFAARAAVFSNNAAIVERLRAAYSEAEFSLDDAPFSHLTFDEFAAARLPRMPSAPSGGPRRPLGGIAPLNRSALGDAPTAFDWRSSGPVKAVTAVKDQGAMGSCWAFSAVGNVEGQRAIQSGGKALDDLSVEQLIECDDEAGAGQDDVVNADCGVFGGWPYLAYQYWMKAGGVRTAKDMPYCSGIQYGKAGCCLPCMVRGYNKTLCGNHADLFCNTSTTLGQGPRRLCSSSAGSVARLKGWRRSSHDAKQIAADLVATGPLSIALDATIAFQFYKRGILNPSSMPILGGCAKVKPELNHAVLLVGYGSERGRDYWTVKNSWGTKWGEDGYFRFARGTNKCGIEQEVTTAVLT